MRLSIFGASGRTGRHLVEQALAAGHQVIALTRNPDRLGIEHPFLTSLHGDIQDGEAVERAISGSDAVLSVLGPVSNQPTYEISKGMANILAAMQKSSVRRLVISSGAGVGDPNDRPGLADRMIGAMLKRAARWVYEDMKCVVELVRACDRDWTIVRVPMLTDEPARGKVRTGWVGKGIGTRLSRIDLAVYMLSQVESTEYFRQAPAISN